MLSLDWTIQRDLWRQEALHIRHLFEQNKHVTNPKELQALIYKLKTIPLGPEGTKWERNLPPIVDGHAEHH
ncbi:unnamed protein product [Cunninghamella blakesleeana]